MPLQPSDLRGVFPALVTPFSATEELDEKLFALEVRYLLSAGVDGLVLAGSTGEGTSLTDDELGRLCEIAVKETNSAVPVIAGVIPDSTREAIRRAMIARDAGVDALLMPPTHYIIPTARGIFEQYQRVAETVRLPIVIYNVLNNVPLSAKQVLDLAEIREVIAVKQGLGHGGLASLQALTELVRTTNGSLAVLEALHALMLPALVVGAHASCTAAATVLPELAVDLYRAVSDKDLDRARELHDRIFPVAAAIAAEPGDNWISRVKYMIELQNRHVGKSRHPVMALNDGEKVMLRSAMAFE